MFLLASRRVFVKARAGLVRDGMTAPRRFFQVDVFGSAPLLGNPLAVVVDAEGFTDAQMQALARWTNLSETTFLLPPTHSEADYRVRIFTPGGELPFAGHPTLGSAYAWLLAGGIPARAGEVRQECAAGLIPVCVDGNLLSFSAPPLIRSGPLDADTLAIICRVLDITQADIAAHGWVDNGSGWAAALLRGSEQVRALKPNWEGIGESIDNLKVGIVGPCPQGSAAQFEVRALAKVGGRAYEDPVTGSLNAGLAQWLLGAGLAQAPYTAAQGLSMGRDGRVFVSDTAGQLWVGGQVHTIVAGQIAL